MCRVDERLGGQRLQQATERMVLVAGERQRHARADEIGAPGAADEHAAAGKDGGGGVAPRLIERVAPFYFPFL